jgi:hypothetical protein
MDEDVLFSFLDTQSSKTIQVSPTTSKTPMARPHKETITWNTEHIPRATKRALAAQEWLKNSPWYLAGGTALALYAGHRKSVDLDFFSPKSSFSHSALITHLLKTAWQTRTQSNREKRSDVNKEK